MGDQGRNSQEDSRPPRMYDANLDEGDGTNGCDVCSHDECYSQYSICQHHQKTIINSEDSSGGCCSAKSFCTLLAILVFIFTGLAIGFAIFPGTRALSQKVFVPLVSVLFAGCLFLMCFMSCRANNLTVIEPTDFPLPEIKKRKSIKEVESFDTDSTTESETRGDDERHIPLFATVFPEVYKFYKQTQKSFDDSRDYLITNIFRPAATLCTPSSQAARCNSAGALSMADIYGPDIECCVDVHCLRDEFGAINLTGTYKLVHNDNFEEFLAAVHIPKLARKAANAAKPIHKYTHIGDSFRVQIDGILKSDTTFTINGPSRTSKIRGLYFLDHLTYLEDKEGVMTRKIIQNDHKTNKRSPGDKSISEIVVTRALSKNGKRMVMKSTAIGCDGSEIAVAVQTFIKVA